jgi:hypothetical protein
MAMSTPSNDPNARSRWAVIYETVSGATAPDHHEEVPGTAPESLKAGHEPDHFDARGIIMVPILVVVTCLLAYILITFLFNMFAPGEPIPSDASPDAKALASKSFNERAARISSSDPKSTIEQPRLEYVKNLDSTRGDVKDPPHLRSFLPAQGSKNTYEITPRDLYPQNYADPQTGEKSLSEYKWLNKDKGVAQIPVTEAMHLLAGKLPAKKQTANNSTATKSKLSNGGQEAIAVAAPASKDEKHDDHKHEKK